MEEYLLFVTEDLDVAALYVESNRTRDARIIALDCDTYYVMNLSAINSNMDKFKKKEEEFIQYAKSKMKKRIKLIFSFNTNKSYTGVDSVDKPSFDSFPVYVSPNIVPIQVNGAWLDNEHIDVEINIYIDPFLNVALNEVPSITESFRKIAYEMYVQLRKEERRINNQNN